MHKNIHELLEQVLPVTANWKISLLKNWSSIVGDLRKQVCLEKIDGNHKLILGVYNTIWIQELYFLSNMLIEKINSTLEYPYIKQLHFKYSPPKKKLRNITSKIRVAETPLLLTLKEQQALNRIQDPELRQSLQLFYKRCKQRDVNEIIHT